MHDDSYIWWSGFVYPQGCVCGYEREIGVVRILDKAWSSFVKIELLPKFGYAKVCPKYTLDKVSEVIDRNN
jgi:hypothetical protein